MAKPKMNEVRIIANLGRDPELRYTNSGFAIAEFSVAIDNSYFKAGQRGAQGEWINKTAWRKITATGKLAEWVGRNLVKGDCVFISGREDMDQWVDQKSGENRYKEFIKAQAVHIVNAGVDPEEDARPNQQRQPQNMGGTPQGRTRQQQQRAPQAQQQQGYVDDGAYGPEDPDIPF